jgi:hypothetical protein
VLPADALKDLAVSHGQLGNIYADARDIDTALVHWRESIHYEDRIGDTFAAAQTRSNVALGLARAGRFADAEQYAVAAKRDFQAYGEKAAPEIERGERLIKDIKRRASNL